MNLCCYCLLLKEITGPSTPFSLANVQNNPKWVKVSMMIKLLLDSGLNKRCYNKIEVPQGGADI